jgi:hypothetical protein
VYVDPIHIIQTALADAWEAYQSDPTPGNRKSAVDMALVALKVGDSKPKLDATKMLGDLNEVLNGLPGTVEILRELAKRWQ